MKLTDVKHIFFDLDHTLWDFDKNSELAFRSVFAKHKILIETEKFLKIYTPINENYWKLYREDRVTKEDLRHGRLKESFDALKMVVEDEQIKIMAIDYIDHLPNHNHLLEGTLEILEYLQNYRLHIITNGFREVQYKKMKSSGILGFFKTITTSEDVGVKKPNPKIFEAALEKAGATAAESLMIGDNFEADILGAEEVGMKTILYNYYKKKFSPEYHQVLEMKELAHFL